MTWYVSPTAAALSICVSSRAPAVMSQLSEHPCSRPRPPRHLVFSLDILHQNIVTGLQHYKRNNPFINNQGSRNSHLMWNVWVRRKGLLCEHVRCHLFASERPLSGWRVSDAKKVRINHEDRLRLRKSKAHRSTLTAPSTTLIIESKHEWQKKKINNEW